ncbi:MAG: cbb3-type cytochrome c oxidase subunit I [Myxococcota bacterium]|nr:cbb3-type cytochrome c oxidase subunit I [Myxococcota bacterium]
MLRPFALLALATGLAGSTLGFILLIQAQWANVGVGWPWRQVHGQLQVFGFLIPFVTGFAIYLVPRVAGGQPIRHRWLARLALGGQAVGVVWVALASTLDQGGGWPRRLAAASVLVGTLSAALALRGPVAAHARAVGGRSKVGYLWLLEGAVAFLALAGAADAWALWSSGPHGLLQEVWAQAAYRLGIEGFAVGMALAIAARMFTGFLGLAPGSTYPAERSAYRRAPGKVFGFWIATLGWAASVVGAALALAFSLEILGALAELLFSLSVLHFAVRLGLGRSQGALAIDRTVDPVFPLGARASLALLTVSAVIGAAGAVAELWGASVQPIWGDARRHALTIGFLLTLIATMAGRLAPGFAGRKPWAPRLRVLAILCFSSGGLLRTLEGAAAQWDLPRLFLISAASGGLALVGFCALVASLGVTLLTAPTAH